MVASRLLERFSEASPFSAATEKLTPRELGVLTFVAQGLPNKEIAERLSITQRTVKFHVSSIMGKLGAANCTEAVALAVQQRLIER